MRLFNRYFSAYDFALILGDFAITFGTAFVVRWVLLSTGMSSSVQWLWTVHGLVMASVVVISFYYADLYAVDQTLSVREMLLRFLGALGIACIIIGLMSYPIPDFGKGVYLSEMAIMGICLGVWRVGFLRILSIARTHAKVLVVGLQAIGKVVAEELCRQQKLGMEVIGFVDRSPGEVTLSYGNPRKKVLPVFPFRSLSYFIEQKGISRILLAGAEGCPDAVVRDLVTLRAKGMPIEDCHSFYERLVSKIPITDLTPEWIVLCKGFRRDRLVMVTKRILDQVASLVGLVLSAPLCLLVAAVIKLESRGPIFYRQERVGQNERPFTLYKFRSMREEAEASMGPVWAAQNDPRVTRIGKIIRKLRIDEIPQMYNVLKGEMSFVGPRPERPFFVEGLKSRIPYYYLRHSVKPGITGWAQISYPYGDSEEGAIEKLQYDLYYIKNMTPLFDLQIIFESFKVILLGTGAR
ncbi:MAG: TIGR03013 family XrtA/PEP-CTERM system glycosyltransferase [Alphaproteobacteria bacterium]